MQTIIGVDYSLFSPAVAILQHNKITYYIFPREGSLRTTFIHALEESGVIVTILGKSENGTTSQEKERFNSIDSALLAESICNTIKPFVDNDTIICIEGMSFNAPGNTKITYAGYHFILRYVMHQILNLDYSRMHVLAPTSIKMTAGKGNFKKEDMINAFISTEFIYEDSFRKKFIEEPILFQSPKAHNVVKPIDDMVDAFWAIQSIKKLLKIN